MTAVAVAAPERTWLDRLTAALPLATVFFWLCMIYGVEAWLHGTPWLFTDELELTQLSRSIAATGHAARRGDPHSFGTLYTYLLAPAWWISSAEGAYSTAKYVGVVIMTATLFPAYALARMIVGPRAALFAGAASAAIPAFLYASMFVPEPLAYPYSTLGLFLIVKALATRSTRWIVGAGLACAVAPLVRSELAVLPAVFVLAALALWWTGERMRERRASWTGWDWAGAVTFFVGSTIVLNAFIVHRSYSWYVATTYYKDRMLDNGLWAVGALTIGLGVLPVVGGLAALVRPRGLVRTETERAFVAVAAMSVVGFAWYTAVKAAYISTVFSTLVEERNLIYLSPVLLAATALFLERPRLRPLAVLPPAALALYVMKGTDYKMDVKLYSDAPGFSILQAANRTLGLTPDGARIMLLCVLAGTVALLVGASLVRGRERLLRPLLATAVLFVLAWNLTGQIGASGASKTISDDLLANYPRPLDWLDRADGGKPAVYLGQQITDANGIWLLEFWNSSLHYVWSLDGTAKGPGPTLSPDLLGTDGRITAPEGVRYVVVEPNIDLVGRVVARARHYGGGAPQEWRLFEIASPLRLRDAAEGIYADGWSGKRTAYSRYLTPGNRPGYAVVTLSRAAFNGNEPPGHVTIRVGPLRVRNKQPALAKVTGIERWTIRGGASRTFYVPVPKPPWRVEVLVAPTFKPALVDPHSSEMRDFGAQVGYGYVAKLPR
jgi:hypothetical protein